MSDKSNEWEELLIKVSKRFNVLADFDFLLFIIGIQERGQGFQKYEKQDKMDMINLARCVLFEQCGYYKQKGVDEEGWPEFEVLKKVEDIAPSEREAMLKKAMIDYLNDKL
ncbi:hypothetical protein [Saccharicrinis aurantiacus]|uniref:hypothetical protein n=1 Tax=Saccharicrinis aurantiacus TaxID=1849719 RepID=UPI0024901348|nr:hypothetical protein [Saccharicrinis aurantiacus]